MGTAGKLATDLGQRIRDLAQLRMDDPVVLSLYLSLDPSGFATARERDAQIESLADRARTQLAALSLPHDGGRGVSEDIERVRRWAKDALDPHGARGIAVFCCSQADTFETFKLSSLVEPAVHIQTTPYLETLITSIPQATWAVFLVNRRTDRIFRGSRDHLIDVGHAEDSVHGKHDQGGWSQARYQRSVEKEVSDHVQLACDRLFGAFKRTPFDKLLVGCPEELWPEVESTLHSYLTERVIARFDAEVEHSNQDDVLERARPLIEQNERAEEKELLDRFAQQLGRGLRACAGFGPVLDALNADRVEVLLLTPGLEAGGVVCPRCGWIGTEGGKCPVDGSALDRTDNLIERAVLRAILQSADVHEVRYQHPDRALGASIAALLRF